MTQFATSDELSAFLNRVFTTAERERADQSLVLASGIVQGIANQAIEPATNQTLILSGDGTGLIFLPELPVTAVDSVTEDGTLLIAGADYTVDLANGILVRLGGAWATSPKTVVVVVDHGQAVPPAVKAVVLGVASRLLINPDGTIRESIGSYSGAYPGLLTDVDLKILGRLDPTARS